MSNSSLSALYDQCRLCANTTLIAFQDENGYVQIGNFTSAGWTLTQLGAALRPIMGTGLALQTFYRKGLRDQINLYHQKSNFKIGLACWEVALIDNDSSLISIPHFRRPLLNLNIVDGWSLNAQVYDNISFGSPIAAASSYANLTSGFENWIEVLFISHRGVQVNTWSGAINDWLEFNANPSVMANSTSNPKLYGSVAVTATGNAFGVVKQTGQMDKIENWQVEDDMVDWKLVGNVDLGGAWGG